MLDKRVLALFVAPKAGNPMQDMQWVMAETGHGLIGDRYARGEGSWNKDRRGNRQVTLIESRSFFGKDFTYADSRRNIVTVGIELMPLIGETFKIDDAVFYGVKYCDPCDRPSKLAGLRSSFKADFLGCGGLIADVIEGGLIRVGDAIVLLPKSKSH